MKKLIYFLSVVTLSLFAVTTVQAEQKLPEFSYLYEVQYNATRPVSTFQFDNSFFSPLTITSGPMIDVVGISDADIPTNPDDLALSPFSSAFGSCCGFGGCCNSMSTCSTCNTCSTCGGYDSCCSSNDGCCYDECCCCEEDYGYGGGGGGVAGGGAGGAIGGFGAGGGGITGDTDTGTDATDTTGDDTTGTTTTTTTTDTNIVIPEPSTYLMLGTCLFVALLIVRARVKKKSHK